ncbi:hypothetical protein [Roseomonas indoligenes]|uniref:Lipoprotein n=1 Tax=Roseomonas indoligenes TaxID=2820811 RepID=A0A940MX94_9PROT|nr:hypothetical protein [Pararoseomonas indoligenes]MBP0492504.1 hypothetical protein [Pararoseomonas indoligenes]
MHHSRALLRVTAIAALATLAACANAVPPPAPTTEPMRGAPLPVGSQAPVSGPAPAITTEPMRGAPLSSGSSGAVNRSSTVPDIGTEPMRGAPLPSSTDQRTRY